MENLAPVLPTASIDAGSVRTHYQSPGAAILIPASQAVTTGLFLGLAAGSIANAANRPDAWGLGLLAGSVSQAAAWLLLLRRWAGLVWRLESALGLDINQDGEIGEPTPQTIRVEVSQDEGRSMTFAELPIPADKLALLGDGLTRGASFSEAQWTGRGAPFARSEFRKLREIFLKRGWMVWANPNGRNQGLELTCAGRAVMRRFAALSSAPSPTLRRSDPTA